MSVSWKEEMHTNTLLNVQQLDDMTVKERQYDTLRDIFGKEAGTEVEELNPTSKLKSLFGGSKPALGNTLLEIGTYPVNNKIPNEVTLTSDIRKELTKYTILQKEISLREESFHVPQVGF